MWKGIVIHHSGTKDTGDPEYYAYRRWHVEGRGWQDIGYHFVVEKAGSDYIAICGRPLNMVGSHCLGLNSTNLGICLAGDLTVSDVPEGQMRVLVRLVAGLCDSFNIPVSAISLHKDHSSTLCPGNFPIDDLRTAVRARVRAVE